MAKQIIGLDIGSSSVKVVQIKKGKKGLELQAFGMEPLMPQTIVDGTVMDHGDMPAMPGMLTDTELDMLAAATGEAFDRLFLELMIRHHRGAITMVHDLFATDGAAQDEDVFRLASDVQVDQITEVNRMQRMLDAMSHQQPQERKENDA